MLQATGTSSFWLWDTRCLGAFVLCLMIPFLFDLCIMDVWMLSFCFAQSNATSCKALVNQSFSCYLLSRTATSASLFIEVIWQFAADFGKCKQNHIVLLIARALCIFREHSSLIRAPYIARICTHKPQTLLKLPPIHRNLKMGGKSIKQSSKLGAENLSFQHNCFALFWCRLVAQYV